MRSDRSQETILSEAAHDSKGTDLTSVVPCHVIKATLNTVERKETNKNIRTMQAIRDNDDIEEIGRPPPAMVTHTVVVGDAAATAAPRGRNGRTATAPGVVAAATAPTGEWAAAATNGEWPPPPPPAEPSPVRGRGKRRSSTEHARAFHACKTSVSRAARVVPPPPPERRAQQ
ncbi:uncharacterized protein LOC105663579 isoform X2 [Megachile rotundata]|uniref:uncharacterized protein LOC105663579 isoform X2 n=1 Tax=Megachile rotundata TaxID=143995 RepID=UPI003FD291B9